ncbi:MAG: SH3 domain-containing protein [Elusimicrobia bacterium]|nr:SH3 domain-containing protein [Elusimicrobiota bacterium]
MKRLLSIIFFLALVSAPALAAKYASIGIAEANIRSCGGTKCAVKWKAWKYTPVAMTAVSKDKKWVQIKDFAGHTGWIYYTSLSKTKGVAAKTDLNVRKTASSTGEVACSVEKGYAFKFLSKSNGWLNVSDWPEKTGDPVCQGWVYGANVWAPAVK